MSKFLDGITSLTNALANRRTAAHSNRMESSRVDWDELRAMYRSGMGSKIIRLKSGTALNDTLQFDTVEDKELYEKKLARLVKDCAKFMLAFGRAMIVIHDKGADLSEPLSSSFDQSTVCYHVFSGDMIYVQSVNLDLSSPNYFKPTRYSVRAATIHPSRVIDFTYVKPVSSTRLSISMAALVNLN